jgi:hypothetical protein
VRSISRVSSGAWWAWRWELHLLQQSMGS